MQPNRNKETKAALREKVERLERKNKTLKSQLNISKHVISDLEEQRSFLTGVALKELEVKKNALEKINIELARSNKELEEFAYVASHDLQEPLRKVTNFTQLLSKRYSGELDEKAERYIEYIVDAATRMQTLIQDLLSFSRIGKGDLSKESTNLTSVAKQVIADMETTIKTSKAKVEIAELPVVTVDQGQISRLLQNLVSNAIKYKGEESPVVHIRTRKENGVEVISVQDNGIGIEPEFVERVFALFQRLHTRQV